jgi:outer membrane protein assembly factor BamB
VVNGIVYVTGDTVVYAVDAKDGHVRWTASPGPSNESPAVANGVVYACMIGTDASMGRIYACDALTGKTLWLSDLINGGVDTNSSPTVANGIVYIGSGQGGLVAFDAATGHKRWVTASTAGSTGSSPTVANGVVYNVQSRIYAFDAITGTSRWVSEDIEAANADSPLVANGVIYVCSLNHSVYALEAATGRILWTSAPTLGQIFTTPSISNGTLYVATADSNGSPNGIVYAYRLSDKI